MSDFILTSPDALSENAFTLIGKDWMLITPGYEEKYITIGTGGQTGVYYVAGQSICRFVNRDSKTSGIRCNAPASGGVLWNESVAFAFIRPQRYTYEFTENNGLFTLSFFDEEYRSALRFCGANSGRDCDKAEKTGLTPVHEDGLTYFAEAKLVLVCEKLYAQDLTAESFVDKAIIDKNYPNNDFHRMYVGKIVKCLKKA